METINIFIDNKQDAINLIDYIKKQGLINYSGFLGALNIKVNIKHDVLLNCCFLSKYFYFNCLHDLQAIIKRQR